MTFRPLSLIISAALTLTALPFSATADTPRVEIQWLGAATMRLSFDGYTLLTDPAFGGGRQAFKMIDPNAPAGDGPPLPVMHTRLTPFPGIDTATVNHVLLSHLHEDHFDQEAQARLSKKLPVVLPESDASKLSGLGFTAGHALLAPQTLRIDTANGRIDIVAVPAEHSFKAEVAAMLDQGNGYWIRFQQGDWSRTVYWTGDTFPTGQVVNSVKRLGQPDLLIGHTGGVGKDGMFGQISMDATDFRALADAIKPRAVLPIHHSTFALYREPVWKVAEQFADGVYRYTQISEGSTLVID